MRSRMPWSVCVSVCLFAASATALPSNVAAWQRDGTTAAQNLGATVTTAGDFNCDGISDLAIGVPKADTLPNGTLFWTDGGWVGVWFGGATLPPQPTDPPDWFVFGGVPATNQTGARMGTAVAAGDVNRDGCDDLISSAPGASFSGEVVNVFFGSSGGLPTTFSWRRFTSASTGARYGQSVATGDVNGDGTADILVGAPEATFGEANEGAVLVWLGSQFLGNTPDGDASSADWRARLHLPGWRRALPRHRGRRTARECGARRRLRARPSRVRCRVGSDALQHRPRVR